MCSKGMFAAEISRLKLFLLFALTFYFSLQDQLLFVVTKERSQKMFIASQPFNVSLKSKLIYITLYIWPFQCRSPISLVWQVPLLWSSYGCFPPRWFAPASCHDQHGRHGVTDSMVCSNAAHLRPPWFRHEVTCHRARNPRLDISIYILLYSTGSCQSSSSILAYFNHFKPISISRRASLQPGNFSGGFLQAPWGAGRGPGEG